MSWATQDMVVPGTVVFSETIRISDRSQRYIAKVEFTALVGSGF